MSVADLAVDRLLLQHSGKPKTEAFIRSFYSPVQRATDSVDQLLFLRGVDTSSGRQLDGVGDIVGLSRLVEEGAYGDFFGFASQPSGRAFGVARMRKEGEAWATSTMLPEEEFRTSIRGKILLNNGHGTSYEIEKAARQLFSVQYAYVKTTAPGKIDLYIGRAFVANYAGWRLYSYLLPVGSGIQVTPKYWNGLLSKYPSELAGEIAP